MSVTEEQIHAGQAVYTARTLKMYDFIVLGISNKWIWKCPTRRIEAQYDAQVSANHLDVGVGTGHFLDNCHFPTVNPRVALMDMNRSTLDYASARIARHQPETYQQNILEEITQPIEPFDSIGINYLLHCVPGSIPEKAIAFDHLKPLMNPGCRIFGSTILHEEVPKSWAAKRLMAFYNHKGIFSNTQDTLTDLNEALTQRFNNVQIETVGCVALFSATTR
ncbi:hypothetical protein Rhal01_03180 [Rubritalea halochordaticola]|uniref:Class I SAM-dependent methyltransferase n=1 Tax=Rubritalea halochordaticola TaxID=714537 RepID=A0ABP9V2U6_9BACT